MPHEVDKTRQAARVLAALGSDYAAPVLKHLPAAEVEKIMREMISMKPLSAAEKKEVLKTFQEETENIRESVQTGPEAAAEFLRNTLGEEKAAPFLAKLEQSQWEKRFSNLTIYKPEIVASVLVKEMPQSVAAILTKLPPDYSARVIKELPQEFRVDILRRMSKTGNFHPEAMLALLDSLEQKLEKLHSNEPDDEIEGENKLAEILAHLNSSTEENILQSIEEDEPDMVERIKERLYQFEELLRLNIREMRILFEKIPQNSTWALALKGAGNELRRHILSAVSINRAADIQAEMEDMGPVPVQEIEHARRMIMKEVERADKAGEIILRKEKEEYVE